MKYNIIVDINRMTMTQRKMMAALNDIQDICKECYRKIDETKDYFDTPTSAYFRQQATEMIDMAQNYIKKEVIPFVESINDIVKEYQNLMSDISKSI